MPGFFVAGALIRAQPARYHAVFQTDHDRSQALLAHHAADNRRLAL